MFQLAWLRFTQPRVDSAAYRAFTNQVKAAMVNQHNQPSSVFSDTVTLTMAQHNPRVRVFVPERLDSVDLVRAAQIYKERVVKRGYSSGAWGWQTAYRETIAKPATKI